MKKYSWLNPIFLTFCLTLGNGSKALADQCSYITKEQSLAATRLLNIGQTIYQFCEPCGDRKPTPISIKDLSAGTTGYQDYWEVQVNGSNIDLAYTYVDAANSNQQVNLAAAVGCSASNVSIVLPKNEKRQPVRQK